MIERLEWMIVRGSGDFHSGSLTVYKSRTLVEELTRLTDSKVPTQYVEVIQVRNIHTFSQKICPQERSKRPRAGNHVKQTEKSQRRPVLVELVRLQVKNLQTVMMNALNSPSPSQTSRTNRLLRSSANTCASMICDTRTTKTRTGEGAWCCSSPRPCSRVVSVFFHSFLMLNL